MWVIVEMHWAYDDIDRINVIGTFATFEIASEEATKLRAKSAAQNQPGLPVSHVVKPLLEPLAP